MTIRRLAAGVLTAGTLTAGALAAAPTATASPTDWGDGSTRCNRGEICLSYQYGGATTVRIRHFYNDAEYKLTTFSDGTRLVDNTGGFRNLDTQCNVYFWDRHGDGTWYVHAYTPSEAGVLPGGTTSYRAFVPADRDRSNGHTRCQSTREPEGR